MKIRIITHHQVHNHGALLQLYALMQVLKQYDSSVCALEYTKNYDFLDDYANTKYNISIKSIPFYLGYTAKKGLARTEFNVKKKILLDTFKRKKNLIGEYYSKERNLDAVFVGSDEVFSIEAGLNPWFWGMGIPCQHVFAYAGCFGPTTIDYIKEKYAYEFIEAGIKRIERISVRDDNSRKIIKTISGRDCEQLCDPVILYGYEKERCKFKQPCQDKYLFVYSYDENMNQEEETKPIIEYARKNGLKVYTAGFFHKWCDKSINVDPIQLLEWINSAEMIITDTFHGTVMAMIMNRPFVTKIRENRNKLGFLLDEYGLANREISNFKQIERKFAEPINYVSVNKIIDEKRRQGKHYIESCLQIVK